MSITTVDCSLQRPTELHKTALAAGAPSLQTLLSLWEFMSYNISPDPTLFDTFGNLHPQNLLPPRTDRCHHHWVFILFGMIACWLCCFVVFRKTFRIWKMPRQNY